MTEAEETIIKLLTEIRDLLVQERTEALKERLNSLRYNYTTIMKGPEIK